jgi:glycine cleavage system H protein
MEHGFLDQHAIRALEYLVAVAFLILFVPFWKFLNPRVAPAASRARAAVAVRRPLAAVVGGWFEVPVAVGLHPGHAWARPDGDGSVLVGADDFARTLLGRVARIDAPGPGAALEQGGPAWALHGEAGTLPMVAPVGGEVIEINPRLLARPEAVSEDPYGEGWILRLRAPALTRQARQLLGGDGARAFLEQTARAFRATFMPGLGPAAADGGVPVLGAGRELDPEAWDRVVRTFFLADVSLDRSAR